MLLSIIYTYVIVKNLTINIDKDCDAKKERGRRGEKEKDQTWRREGGGRKGGVYMFPPPVFDCSQYANWRQEWPGTRLSQPGSGTQHIQCHVVR